MLVTLYTSYIVWHKILTGENIDKFDQFVNIFPIKIFLATYMK